MEKRPSQVVCEIIAQHGLGYVAGFEGCDCGSFAIGGIHASLGCRKSSGANKESMPGQSGYGTSVYVWGQHCDRDDLTRVARAITGALNDQRFAVRFCDPAHDRKNRCVYCHAERGERASYLCDFRPRHVRVSNISEARDSSSANLATTTSATSSMRKRRRDARPNERGPLRFAAITGPMTDSEMDRLVRALRVNATHTRDAIARYCQQMRARTQQAQDRGALGSNHPARESAG